MEGIVPNLPKRLVSMHSQRSCSAVKSDKAMLLFSNFTSISRYTLGQET